MKSRNYVVLYLAFGFLFFLSGTINAQSRKADTTIKKEKIEEANAKQKATKNSRAEIKDRSKATVDGTKDVKKVEAKKEARRSRTAKTATSASGQSKKMIKRKKFKGKVYRKGDATGKSGKPATQKKVEEAKAKNSRKNN